MAAFAIDVIITHGKIASNFDEKVLQMLRSPVVPVVLLVLAVVSVSMFAFGGYQVITSGQKYDQVASVITPALIQDAQHNQASADILAHLTIDRDAANTSRSNGFIFVGAGAVLLGIAAFGYTLLPDKPRNKN